MARASPLQMEGVIMGSIEIIGSDATRYIIPVNSVKSVNIRKSTREIEFCFFEDIGKNCGCTKFKFSFSHYTAIQSIIKQFKKRGGNCPISYNW